MTNRLSLFAAAAVFSAVSFAAPKAYKVVISEPVQIGTTQFAPGSYKMALEGNKAVFSLPRHEAVAVPVKVETATRKYQNTVLDTLEQGGVRHLNSIALGGSTNKVEFNQ